MFKFQIVFLIMAGYMFCKKTLKAIWVADPGFLKEAGGGGGLTRYKDIGTIRDKIASVIVLFPFTISGLNDPKEVGG